MGKSVFAIAVICCNIPEKIPYGAKVGDTSFEGRKSVERATSIKPSMVDVLGQDPKLFKTIEVNVHRLLKLYTVKDDGIKKVMNARTQMFANFGKLLEAIGSELERVTLELNRKDELLTPAKRRQVLEKFLMGEVAFARIETAYRTMLMNAEAKSECDMPTRMFEAPEATMQRSTTGRQTEAEVNIVESPFSQSVTCAGFFSAGENASLVNKASVLKRLGIDELPSRVLLSDLSWLSEESNQDYGSAQDSTVQYCTVLYCSRKAADAMIGMYCRYM